MGLSRRFQPEKDPAEVCSFGMDFAPILAPGVGIVSASLAIFTNTAVPLAADLDFTVGPVQVQGRAVYVVLGGGKSGIDYRLQFTATDTDGNVWPRTALVLVSATS
jgi:hypothetical protein